MTNMLTVHRIPCGMEAHYTWDRHAPDGRVVGQQEAGGLARSYTSRVDHTQVIDSLGREERYHFVGSGPDGTRWAIERDALGQPVRIEGPDDQRWQITRNERGHPREVTGPEGTTAFAYDNTDLPDRPTTVTDAMGATHQREWNALGQVTAQIDCSQQRTEYAYDRNGYLASVTNALNETTRIQHDEMGRRIATQLPDVAASSSTATMRPGA